MWDLQGIQDFVEDETMCGPLCQHPSCWNSNNRRIKGIPHIAHRLPPSDSIETDLPTVKVYNMLEDYGDDEGDLFPTKHKGKAAHHRKHSLPLVKDQMTKTNSSGFKLKAPAGTPRSMDTKELENVTSKKQMKIVEVQEVFDVKDLNSTWDNTFVPKQCLVWVPNPNYRRKVTEDQMASINQLSKGTKPKLLLKDLTGDILPADLDYDQMSFSKRRRGRSPPPSSRRMTPYSRSAGNFSSGGGRRPPFIFDMQGNVVSTSELDELLELPRDVLVHVLDNAKPSDFTSRETMHALIEKFYPSFDRGCSNLTSTSQQELLQQKKMNIHEGKTRNIRTGHLIETKPVFHLDEDGVEQPRHIVEALSERSHQPLDSEYVESIRDLYMNRKREYNLKKPLPPIGKGGKSKVSSISLGLPELPSGVRQTKTFTYNRRNYLNFDLTIAPVPTPPTSVRESVSQGSEHGTTVRVNVPTSEDDRKEANDDTGSTDTPHSSKSGRDAAPLHTVSPSFSTKVPHAPATTPATHQTPTGTFTRDNTMRSHSLPNTRGGQETRESTMSPTQNIRAPTNSPRLSPEPTGLHTIKEAQHEDGKDMPQPVSRRSVRFSKDVPEVPAPPSTPDRDIEGPRSSVTTPIDQPETPKPTSGHTVQTTKSTVNSTVRENSDLESKPRMSKIKDPSSVSTPEPWPAVNEADYDLTPSGTNQGLHESSQNTHSSNVNMDSRLAIRDPSSRSQPTANSTTRSDLGSGTSLASGKGESPGPPPPSPEGRDKRQEESKSGRRRELISRESSMAPLIEEKDDDHEDVHIRTLVVEVPPLGQPTETPKKKNNRTTDTFINIDIPATSEDDTQNLRSSNRNGHMTEIIEQTLTEENESSGHQDNQTINTRDAVLSVQTTSDGDTLTIDPDSQSYMDSAGVTPSIGANTSPTSTIPENKLKLDDLKFMDQNINDVEQDEDQKINDQSQDTDNQDLEMTEDGGDHEGFKQELQEELKRLSQKDMKKKGEKVEWNI